MPTDALASLATGPPNGFQTSTGQESDIAIRRRRTRQGIGNPPSIHKREIGLRWAKSRKKKLLAYYQGMKQDKDKVTVGGYKKVRDLGEPVSARSTRSCFVDSSFSMFGALSLFAGVGSCGKAILVEHRNTGQRWVMR
jgi:hypothetical protein